MNKHFFTLSMGVLLAVAANGQNNNSQAVIPWKSNGNEAAAEHFIGTTNQRDLVFKSNSLEGIRLLTDGNIRLEQLKLQPGDNTLDLPRVMVLKDDGTIRLVQGEELLKLITLDAPAALECTDVAGNTTYSTTWRPKAGNPAQLYAYSACGPVNVGINTNNPEHALHIVGNSLIKGTGGFSNVGNQATLFLGDDNHYIRSVKGGGVRLGTYQAPDALTIQEVSGFVGIGIDEDKTPQAALDVNGWISLGGGIKDGYEAPASGALSGSGGIYFPSTNNDFLRITSEHNGDDVSNLVFYTADNPSDGVIFKNFDYTKGESEYLFISKANMNYCGVIRSKEILVESGWCDYVFEESYQRMTLEEKEQYIKENKHLPMVTPGAEIEEKGLNVGDNMKGFVYNLENLTLDQIELYKMIQDLQKQQVLLQQKIEQLEEENKKLQQK